MVHLVAKRSNTYTHSHRCRQAKILPCVFVYVPHGHIRQRETGSLSLRMVCRASLSRNVFCRSTIGIIFVQITRRQDDPSMSCSRFLYSSGWALQFFFLLFCYLFFSILVKINRLDLYLLYGAVFSMNKGSKMCICGRRNNINSFRLICVKLKSI